MSDMIDTLLPQDELNPEFWPDGAEGKINPDVRYHLLKVAKSFKDSWDLATVGLEKVKVADVHATGSICNYNWNATYSDVDLHLKVDYSEVDEEYKETVNAYLIALKNIYNSEHNISIKGFEVEVYPEDVDKQTVSTGIYSLVKDEWVIEPKHLEVSPDREYIHKKVNQIVELVQFIESQAGKLGDEKIAKLLDHVTKKIKKFRQASLNDGGEFAEGNLVFKVLRRLGTLDKVYELKNKFTDQDLTLSETAVCPICHQVKCICPKDLQERIERLENLVGKKLILSSFKKTI